VNEELPTVKEDQVLDHIRNLKMHKSMGPDEVHPQMKLLCHYPLHLSEPIKPSTWT